MVAPVSSSPGLRMALLVVAALALGHAAFHHGRDRLAPAPPAFVAIPLALWAALATASLAWSVNPAYTLSELRPEIVYAALAFGVFHFAADARRVRLWSAALLAGTAALAVADLVRELVAPHAFPLNSGDGRFTTHLVMVAPFLAMLAVDAPAGLGRRPGLLAAGVAVFFVSALVSQNCTVWAAYFVSLATLGLALAPSLPPELRRRLYATAGILAVAIAAFFALSLENKLVVYSAARNAGETIEMDLRLKLWPIAGRAIADRPLAGHGFGRNVIEPRFRAEIGDADGKEFAAHGHNLFLNTTVSLGVAGLLALCALLAALGFAHARNLARPATRLAGAIGLALLAGFVAKNLTDDFFNRHNALVFWALNGMLIGLGSRAESSS